MSIFKDNAQKYLDAGYSPVPIAPGGKAPGYTQNGYVKGLTSWSLLCETPAAEYQLKTWCAEGIDAGIGLALGYNGVCAIDLDYGDGDIREAIESGQLYVF